MSYSSIMKEDTSSTQPVALVQTKSFYVGLVGMVLTVLGSVGVKVGWIDANSVVETAVQIGTAASFVLGWWTRYVASKKVTGIVTAKPVIQPALGK